MRCSRRPAATRRSSDGVGGGEPSRERRGGEAHAQRAARHPGHWGRGGGDCLSLTATFDLTGKATGTWNVVVTNPDLQTATLTNRFTITQFVPPQLRVDIVGPSAFRTGFPAAYDLVIQNPGNVDALVRAALDRGDSEQRERGVGLHSIGSSPGRGEPDWSLVQDTLTTASGRYLALVIPRVSPGTLSRRIWLTVLTTPTFQLTAALTPPWADGNVLRTCLSDGG